MSAKEVGGLHGSTDLPAAQNGKAEVARLARLSPIEYDHERKPTADRLGCGLAALDAEVKGARARSTANVVGQGRALELRAPEPWPEPVNGAQLLTDIKCAIRRHVVIDDTPLTAVTLWIVAAHAFECFDIFPRLFVTATTKRAGKTTLLDVIVPLTPRPLPASSATAAVLFRIIESSRPTLELDEADTWARDSEDIRMVINSGHKRGLPVLRCVGEDHEPRAFDVFAPMVLAAIGRLPETIEDRSIIVQLRRKLPGETVEPIRSGRTELERLARHAARMAADFQSAVGEANPALPSSVVNRAADNWAPLLALADFAGGKWPEGARRAAVELAGGEDNSRTEMLLADIRAVFCPESRLSSGDLVARLVGLEDRPWADYRRGQAMTKAQLGRLLSPHKILSKSLRLSGDPNLKGYELASFQDAFARYLPPDETATTPQALADKGLSARANRHNGFAGRPRGVLESDLNANEINGCGGVALSNPAAAVRP